eukprot:353643-Chlamydomonas_euryale.AAC.8
MALCELPLFCMSVGGPPACLRSTAIQGAKLEKGGQREGGKRVEEKFPGGRACPPDGPTLHTRPGTPNWQAMLG